MNILSSACRPPTPTLTELGRYELHRAISSTMRSTLKKSLYLRKKNEPLTRIILIIFEKALADSTSV